MASGGPPPLSALVGAPGAPKSVAQRYYFSMNELILLLPDPPMSSLLRVPRWAAEGGDQDPHLGGCMERPG